MQVKGDQQLSLNATEERHAGTGTGFVWDAQGHVVTNIHGIKDASNRGRAMVTLTGGTETHAATLVGMEPDKDVAVLKVDAPPEDLKPISVGSSADLLVGQTVIAIGSGNSGAGGLITISSGQSTVLTGGAIGLTSGGGTPSSSR